MKHKVLVLLAIVAVMCWGVVAFPPGAQATAVLQLTSGLTTVTVTDGSAQDSNPLPGWVTYVGAVGSNWYANVTTGVSNSPTPSMDLNSIDGSRGAGTLFIYFGDTGFSGSGAGTIGIGGTTAGNVLYNAYFDSDNGLFSDTVIATLGPFNPGAFSGTAPVSVDATGPYSLTQLVAINHTGAGLTSFDATFNLAVPLPPSALLLASGLLGLVGLGWRRKLSQ